MMIGGAVWLAVVRSRHGSVLLPRASGRAAAATPAAA